MATTAALLPPPLLSAIEIYPPICADDSHLIGDVTVFGMFDVRGWKARALFHIRYGMFDVSGEIRRQRSEIRSKTSGRESDAGLCRLRQRWRRIEDLHQVL